MHLILLCNDSLCTESVLAGRHVPGDEVDNLLSSFMMIYPCYFIHLPYISHFVWL
jgi:hypothetical protein